MADDGEALVPVEVIGVRHHLPADELVVLLLEPASSLMVPIVIGPLEGAAIAAAHAGAVPLRPLTHDLLRDVLEATGTTLDHVEITALIDGVFHACLVLSPDRRIDSRASDAIAIALRTGSPVLCTAEVVAMAGVDVSDDGEAQEIERFREFLEGVEPEDFDPPTPGAPGPPGDQPSR